MKMNDKYFLGLLTRCRDEFFIKEFCDYYIRHGVDKLYIIDDNSVNKRYYDELLSNHKISVLFEKNIITNNTAQIVYEQIRHRFEWLIYVDVDEFITTKDKTGSIRNELIERFSTADCIKIPWVMMGCNRIIESPISILNTNIFRWNHDYRHPSHVRKFRCRYEEIEVKCIFKPSKFKSISDHNPKDSEGNAPKVVDSINCSTANLDPFYTRLTERDIAAGYMLCYHYRIISIENSIKKLQRNYWYVKDGYTLNDLMSSDHPEVIDRRMMQPIKCDKLCFIHIGKCGGSFVSMNLPFTALIHMKIPVFNEKTAYVVWIRNPISRYVSAFNHSLSIIRYDVSGRDFDSLFNDPDTPYYKLKNKIESKFRTGHPFAEWATGVEYESLISYFNTPNALAEALSSKNAEIKNKAISLMSNSEVEHIAKGIGWYLDNGEFIKNYHANIFFVGKVEDMKNDIQRLYDMLRICSTPDFRKIRDQKYVLDTYMSPLAVKNVKEFYEQTDYKALSLLRDYDFIEKTVYESYASY